MLSFIEIYFGLAAFFVGASLASFMNVMVYRMPLNKSVVSPSSACPNCGHKIRWYENIPVVSWLMLRGKCSSCKTSISPQYVITEFLFGAFTVWFLFTIGLFSVTDYDFVALYFLIYFLLTISLIDLQHKMVPLSLLILSFGIALFVPSNLTDAALYGFAALGFFYMFKLVYEYFRGIEVLGEGDLPILGMFGILYGLTPGFSISLGIATVAGFLFYAYFKIFKKEDTLPFVPALSFGLISYYLYSTLLIY